MGSETQPEEMMRLVSQRGYYSSAKLRAGIVRDGGVLKLIGAKCILQAETPENPQELDYGSLVLVESSIPIEKFGDWLTRLVKEATTEFGNHVVPVKGDFEARFDLSQRIAPSGNQFYPLSPVEWPCNVFRHRLAVQSNIPYSLDYKTDLPFFPDARTAWGDWIGVDPERGDIFGTTVFYFPNMAGRIKGFDLTPKSKPKRLAISVKDGTEKASSFKGKAFVQEIYDNSLRIRRSITEDLKFVRNKATVEIPFRPGHTSIVLFDSHGEILDYRRGLPMNVETIAATAAGAPTSSAPATYNPRQVFVVHGRNEGEKDTVCRLLEKSGLEAIVLQERPHMGRTLIEKLEDYGSVGYAVVILSGDDVGGLHDEEGADHMKFRARQNVIFELGTFLGRLGRGRVCVLYKKGVEIPSDLNGLGYVEMDAGGAWRMKLAREMDGAGVSVDMKKIAELS